MPTTHPVGRGLTANIFPNRTNYFPSIYIDQFHRDVYHPPAQEDARTRFLIDPFVFTAETMSFDEIFRHQGEEKHAPATLRPGTPASESPEVPPAGNPNSIYQIEERFERTQWRITEWMRRRAFSEEWAWGELIEGFDSSRSLVEQAPHLLRQARIDFTQKFDTLVYEAALGGAQRHHRSNSGATTTINLSDFMDGRQIIDDFFMDGRNFDHEGLLMSLDKFRKMEIREPLYVFCSQDMISQLLRDEKLTSFDFNTVKALAAGDVNTFAGHVFIQTELVPKILDGNGDHVGWRCVVMTRQAVKFGMGPSKDRTGEHPDFLMNPFILMRRSMGGVRQDERRVVEIQITATPGLAPLVA